MRGDMAIIYFRKNVAPGRWEIFQVDYKIREGSRPLWIKHPLVDVAAFYIAIPEGLNQPGIPTDILATDETLRKYGVHPGEELLSLGYPLGFSGPVGMFPILRSGRIASYPLLPTRETKSFQFDFEVFPGNSGGPVYADLLGMRGGSLTLGQAVKILGIVTGEAVFARRLPLSIATVVHAAFILETFNMLPPPESEESERIALRPLRVQRIN